MQVLKNFLVTISSKIQSSKQAASWVRHLIPVSRYLGGRAGESKVQDYPQVQVQVQPRLNEICLCNNEAIYDF